MSPAVFGIPLVVIVLVYLIDVGWDSTPSPRDDEEEDSNVRTAIGPGQGGLPNRSRSRGRK